MYAAGTQETTAPALKAEEMLGNAVAVMTESRDASAVHTTRPRKAS
jgi:hypothetical protein